MPRDSFFLTKSAFATALSCPAKLYYLSHRYPKNSDEDEYLKLLAEGGFMIGTLARLLHPEGKLAPQSGDPLADFAETEALIASGDGTLFEATIARGRSMAVSDILIRKGNTLHLIEVKSKSFERGESSPYRNKKGDIASEWLPYLYDITFQYVLAKACFPNFEILPSLLMVDKAKRTTLDGLVNRFSLQRQVNGGPPLVEIKGDKKDIIESGNILSSIDVLEAVRELSPMVEIKIAEFELAISDDRKLFAPLGKLCKECEFDIESPVNSGYKECWSGIEKPEHHIFDLYFGTTIKNDGEFLFDQLLAQKKASLFDVPLEALKGKRGERQVTQIEYTKSGREWFDSRLPSFITQVKYPLHFIDFETTRTALPFHAGMRPFEQLAFQWSCHTISRPGEAPVHTEWINTDPEFPNFKFARALMGTLSKEGTVLTWATHEGSVISDIIEQMGQYGHTDEELREFLSFLVSSKGSQGRMVDMNRLTLDYYFHPEMKGRTSIKYVFPSIWRSNGALRKLPWFAPYEEVKDGKVINPYENLPELIIDGESVSVREGTAAMRAYEEMIFGKSARDTVVKDAWKKLLLRYCQLDTLAMVAIWEHWSGLANPLRVANSN